MVISLLVPSPLVAGERHAPAQFRRVEAHRPVPWNRHIHRPKTITANRRHAYDSAILSLVRRSETAYPGFMDMHVSCEQAPGGRLTRW